MEDEEMDEEIKEALQCLQNDHEGLAVGIELLEEEIYGRDPSSEKMKELIEGVELWATGIIDSIAPLEEARIIFQKKRIINSLENKEEED